MVPYVHGPAVAERILQELQCCVPPQLLPAFRYCLEHPENPLSVEQVAAACGIKRRALEYRFWKAGFPPPGGCFARCRLLLAVHHLEHHTEGDFEDALAGFVDDIRQGTRALCDQ